MTEYLATQVAILQNTNKEKDTILSSRQEQQSGKCKIIQEHFMITTLEIQDQVLEAEAQTAARRQT